MTDNFLHWHDKEIRFDVSTALLKTGPGEKIIVQSNHIEDSKGNAGDMGTIVVSNLRCTWYSVPDPRINLSIGYDCILSVDPKVVPTKSGLSYTVNIKAKQKNSRFEFIFLTISNESPKMFEHLKKVFQSYEQTKLYREIKARGAITDNRNLITFAQEKIINRYSNVSSVSADSTSVLGSLYVSNVRLVWYALNNESFNISIPWICIKKILRKELKNGTSLIIETRNAAGGYIVGYRSSDIEIIIVECQKVLQFYTENPILGVEASLGNNQQQFQPIKNQFDEDVEIVDHGYNELPSSQKQYALNTHNEEQQEIIFSPELGLAIERPPQGTKVEDLWKIINIK